MKTPSENSAGAVLVFAVLLLAAGVFVLTGIAQLAATQAVVGLNEWSALSRRVTLDNSRAMARQYVLSVMFSNVVPTNAVGYTNAALGGFSISNVAGPSSGLYWTYATTNAGQVINPFSPMERGGFYPGVARAQLVSEVASTNVANWTFLVRTRSPIAAGYSFVQQRPASAILTNNRHINATNFRGFSNIPQIPVSAVTNTNIDDFNGFAGFFNLPASFVWGASYSGATNVAGDANNTNIRIEIDLDVTGSSALGGVVVFTNIPATADYTTSSTTYSDLPVTGILLKGAEAGANQPPLLIVIPTNAANLTQLFLSGLNEGVTARPVYVRVEHRSNALNIIGTNNVFSTGEWRVGITSKGRSLNWSAGLPKIVGGLRTDTNVSGIVDLVENNDPGGLDAIADQMMWLEDYRAP